MGILYFFETYVNFNLTLSFKYEERSITHSKFFMQFSSNSCYFEASSGDLVHILYHQPKSLRSSRRNKLPQVLFRYISYVILFYILNKFVRSDFNFVMSLTFSTVPNPVEFFPPALI